MHFESPFYVSRHIEPRLRRSLNHMRVVAISGARQTGKTTLCQKIASENNMSFVSLDQKHYYQWAQRDPEGFVQELGEQGGVIDEVQKVPELMMALKMSVDQDPRPGRFLITGSVDLFQSMILPDHLAGRLSMITLHPFSQGEIAKQEQASPFLSQIFEGVLPTHEEISRDDALRDRAFRGGYPQALIMTHADLRYEWLTNYGQLLAERYVREDFAVHKTRQFQRILEYVAAMPGGLVNLSAIGKRLGVNSQTVDRWLWLLENMFIIYRLPVWHHNALKRLTKSPKVYFLDTGLLTALNGWCHLQQRHHPQIKGALIENFVFAEITRHLSAQGKNLALSHFRDKSGREVDFILSRGRHIVAIEVKASTSPSSQDFQGLQYLKDQVKEDFICGILFYDGEKVYRYEDRIYAAPIQKIWS